jgi:hypothetical protein
MVRQFFRLREVLQQLDGDPDRIVDAVRLSRKWKVSERTAWRYIKAARLISRKLRPI